MEKYRSARSHCCLAFPRRLPKVFSFVAPGPSIKTKGASFVTEKRAKKLERLKKSFAEKEEKKVLQKCFLRIEKKLSDWKRTYRENNFPFVMGNSFFGIWLVYCIFGDLHSSLCGLDVMITTHFWRL
jgi:hypothetical protein